MNERRGRILGSGIFENFPGFDFGHEIRLSEHSSLTMPREICVGASHYLQTSREPARDSILLRISINHLPRFLARQKQRQLKPRDSPAFGNMESL